MDSVPIAKDRLMPGIKLPGFTIPVMILLLLTGWNSKAQVCHSDFSYMRDSANVKLYHFFNQSTSDSACTYFWEFGDGNISLSPKPVNVFNNQGKYNVCLTIQNINCKDSVACKLVNVSFCTANFTSSVDAPHRNVLFNNTSSGDSLNFIWTFEDQSLSTIKNPLRSYTYSGIYLVKLIAYKYDSSCFNIKQDSVRVGNVSNSEFQSTIDSQDRKIYYFKSTSTDSLLGYRWDFGDGFGHVGKNMMHHYANNGIYKASLFVNNSDSSSYNVSDKIINVLSCVNPYIPTFSYIADSANPKKIRFSNTTNTGDTSKAFKWNFGTGNPPSSTFVNPVCTFPADGSFPVCFTVYNPFDTPCTTTKCYTVIVNSIPPCKADYNTRGKKLKGDTVYFDNASVSDSGVTYGWRFGDGVIDTKKNTFHIYTATGDYNVCLKISKTGCSDSICKSLSISEDTSCKAAFTYTTDLTIQNLKHFHNTSLHDIGCNYSWSFGDGDTASIKDPDHIFTGTGNYKVWLRITKPGCADSLNQTLSVTGSYCKASFSYETVADSGSFDSLVIFTNTSVGKNVISQWNFGDGAVSSSTSPKHHYSSKGIYPVCLRITSITADTCGDSTCTNVPFGKLAIQDFSLIEQVKVYPVPFSDEINIDFDNSHAADAEVQLQISDLLGIEHFNSSKSFSVSNHLETINTSTLSRGMYFLRLTRGEKSAVMRLVK